MDIAPILVPLRQALYHANTLYLFTKSDMKTIFFPITLFAWCTVPNTNSLAFTRSALWTWLHLLQFCVSNQSLSPDEDAQNKPWRPIPAGRLPVRQATRLRWALLPLCLFLSFSFGIPAVGAVLMVGILLHNELKLDSHWFTRNVLNAIGYATFDAGAMTVAQAGAHLSFSYPALAAHYTSIAIVLTTIHAQDFQDEEGDRVQKRRTIPIVMPAAGRLSMPVGLTLWSLGLSEGWHLPNAHRLALITIGLYVGSRFYFLRSPGADKTSYRLYNVWLAIARISPMYGRIPVM
ncbi:hypothetical protein DICSQDRAFT_69381 [Dichomitus squalens LYAD-421 SS1]|uniref:UbiA prenyltransferase family-domain-containing protein n=1 Tax=Dichomitus squalens (strain LYAD-421) TaxID=732165 RepID=R7SMR1_DICSQ|nr:uncharacterized protein DICSQDRAFT_69381 [Dichomitus squalens LYAD-421 SS1]EJF57469.1 hypothetical protein DICSQDRAFT_69381 [Dichomitus squalens LYAD-421 SS1]